MSLILLDIVAPRLNPKIMDIIALTVEKQRIGLPVSKYFLKTVIKHKYHNRVNMLILPLIISPLKIKLVL